MNKYKFDKNQEQKNLVLARLRTINPQSKIMLGTRKRISVQDLINHVEKGDQIGEKIIQAQMNMLKVLAGSI